MSAFVVDRVHIDLLVRACIEAGRGISRFNWCAPAFEDSSEREWRELDESATGEERARVTPSQLGQILLSENVRSVSYRYSGPGRARYYDPEAAAEMPDAELEELPGPVDRYYLAPYSYRDRGAVLVPGAVFRAIDCLEYQSCETPEWRESEAYRILSVLRHSTCTKVAGYSEAPWEWDLALLERRPSPAAVHNYGRRIL